MDFTEAQQAHIDTLIKKKYAEAFQKAEAKAAEQVAAAEAKHAEEVNTLKAENEKFKAAQGESKERVRQALLKAEVSQSSAVNSTQVMKLINENIIIGEDGNLAVVDDEGKARFTAEGKPYGVKEFVTEYLDQNPHLQRAARSTGAGSMGSTFLSTGAGATSMRRADFDALDTSRKTTFVRSGGHITD